MNPSFPLRPPRPLREALPPVDHLFAGLDFRLLGFKNAAEMARQHGSVDERKNAVERLREFIRLNYLTGNQVAHRIGVRETTMYSWLSGNSTPRDARRITAFLDSMPAERGRGLHRPVMSIGNTRIGEGSPSLGA